MEKWKNQDSYPDSELQRRRWGFEGGSIKSMRGVARVTKQRCIRGKRQLCQRIEDVLCGLGILRLKAATASRSTRT